jgi:putrescine aminotransferase
LIPDVLTTSKSFGGGKSSISAFVAREPLYRRVYDNLGDALLQSTSTTYYGFGEECATALEAVNVAVGDDYPALARDLERVLRPGLARVAKQYPDAVSQVAGAGALWGVFIDGGPRVLDLVAKLAPGGMAKDPRFKTKLVTCAVINALYHDHDVFAYYTLNGRNPLIFAPSLVTVPADVERAVDSLNRTLAQGLGRLVTRFLREKVSTLW